jgi:hypothetical protein
MITREQVRELALFEDPQSCALSFYFQPAASRNKAHKEDAILVKDLAREALHQLDGRSSGYPKGRSNSKKDKCESAHADLERIVLLSQDWRGNDWRGNGVRAKAVFACSAQAFWREYDLPAQLRGSELRFDRHFHLKPLAHLLGALPSLGLVLLDRHRARLFDLRLGELTEREGFFHPLSRRGRGDGFAGYDGGHAERRVADEARQHFKFVAEFVKDALDKKVFENWVLGCQETLWPQFEPQLHPYVSQKLLGRFSADVAHATREEIRAEAEHIFAESQDRRRTEAVRDALQQSRGNGSGVTGLRRVLHALELGQVQTLLLGFNFTAQAVECSACGHLDAHLVSFCPVCGRQTRTVVDVAEAILPGVIRRDIELFYVKDDPEFDRVGNIAALLRFRSDQSRNIQSISDEPQYPSPRARLVGRYRGATTG